LTEIPEHLLKRSRERRAALGLGEGEGEAAQPSASATPAVPQASAPAPVASGPVSRAAAPPAEAPKQPEAVHPTVLAANRRRRVPFWAMAALSLMPIWLFMYARALTPGEEISEGPIGLGAEIYSSCASCHGGAGGGGVGYAFTGGEVLKTYPHIEDMLRYVYYGTGEYVIAGIDIPGDPNREGGPHLTGDLGNMPQFGASVGGGLTDYQILSVVCHERYTLGGADPTSSEWSEEYDTWCSQDSEIFQGLQAGTYGLRDVDEFVGGIIPIGMAPAPGRTAGDR
jgi:mono/diheme cytochrome c family protein